MGLATLILEIVAALLPFLIDWAQERRTNGADHEKAIQAARVALANDDVVGVAACIADQHDRVLNAVGGDRRKPDDLPTGANGQ